MAPWRDQGRAAFIVDAMAATALPESELGEAAAQALFLAMFVRADHHAHGNRDATFGAVRVDLVLAARASGFLGVVGRLVILHDLLKLRALLCSGLGGSTKRGSSLAGCHRFADAKALGH